MYEYDSFVTLASKGGTVEILSSSFNRVSNCGSIIKNERHFF